MKILQLNLIAFGPFTDKRMDFSGGEEGLHVVYGPNEAGKSSALRALRQMLFGFPERSTDNFLYPYHRMRVGGALRHSDGTVIEFVRRKGRVNTLRDGDDREPLDEPLLARFLGNADADLFSTMFGIGHLDLVQGGEQIIRGGGHVGQALFAAGSGISDLRGVQTDLQAEAEALFAQAASKRPINEAMADLRANRKRIREAQLPGREWQRHDQALRSAEARRNEVAAQLARKQSERNRLDRIKASLPLIGRRTELLEELRPYAAAVLLPESFPERRSGFLSELRIAENDRNRAAAGLGEITAALSGLEISEPVIENADLIEPLTLDLGSYQKASKDRIQLDIKRDVLRGEAREILSGLRDDVRLDEVETLRLKKMEVVRIRELGARYERLIARRESSRNEIPRLGTLIRGIDARLASMEMPVRTDDLDNAVEQAVKYGALEDYYRSECDEIRGAESDLELACKRLAQRAGVREALEKTPLPSVETIDTYEALFEQTRKEQAELQYRMNTLEDSLAETDGRIRELRLEREVPTEADLREARRHREIGWGLVRRVLETGKEDIEETQRFVRAFETAGNLPDAYERSVSRADETADRLRREADRVAKMAKHLADQETQHTQLDRLKARRGEIERRLAAAQKNWIEVWEPGGISPRSPREMRGWARDQDVLFERASKIRERAAKTDALNTRIQQHRMALDQCLQAVSEPPAGEKETLSDLIKKGRKVIEAQEERRARRAQLVADRERLEKDIAEAEARAAEIESCMDRWQDEWADAIRPLGLGAGSVPEQANAVIDELKTLFDKLKEADILKKRIEGIERDGAAFTERGVRLAERVMPESAGLPVEQIVTELSARLTRSRSAQLERSRLERRQEQEKETLRDAEARIVDIRSELDSMCKEAGCSRYEDLFEAERHSSRRKDLESDLADLDERLLALSAGAAVDDFVEEVRGIEPDGIAGRLERLREETETLEDEKTRLDRTIGEEENELSKMDGSAMAADLAEETQRILARLESDAARYTRLRLASAVLARAIERYRERHQGPILKRTSGLFADLTRRAFEGIRAEFDGQGNPVLVGVRAGGKEIVGPEGMSDGANDQLYLALRLASLESYLEHHEPMPFILDDILIQFDNERAAASLTVLGELSKRTQVIFFTHHRHLVEMAERDLDASVLFLHEL